MMTMMNGAQQDGVGLGYIFLGNFFCRNLIAPPEKEYQWRHLAADLYEFMDPLELKWMVSWLQD